MAVNDAQGASIRRAGTAVSHVRSISAIGVGRALRDVTTLSDTVHVHKKNIPDIPDIQVECYFDPEDSTHANILQDDKLGSLQPWQIYLEQGNSPGEVIEFSSCYVHSAEVQSIEVDGDLVLSFSLKPQALPVGLFDENLVGISG
jgi:hypothetical protein